MAQLLPFPLGYADASGTYTGAVGNVYGPDVDGKVYRLVSATAAITAPARKAVVTAFSAGVPTYAVDVTSTAANGAICGVVPTEYGSTTIAIGAVFLVQIAGPASVLAQSSSIVDTQSVGLTTSTDAGVVCAISSSATPSQALRAVFAFPTNTTGVSSGSPITCILEGLW